MPTKTPNRYGLLLLALLGAGLILHLMPVGRDSGFIPDLFDIGHVAGFAVLGYVLVRLLQSRQALAASRAAAPGALPARAAPYVAAAAIALGLGTAAEAVQMVGPRDASWDDVLRDASGVAAGLLAAFAFGARDLARRAAAIAAAALVALGGAADPGLTLLARVGASMRFPVLADFESPLELRLVRTESARVDRVPAPAGWPETGRVARIETRGRERFEGVWFRAPRDWTGYDTLAFTIAADEPADVRLQIGDATRDFRYGDRFDRSLAIGTEPIAVRIPLADVEAAPRDGTLDVSRIENLILFMVNSPARVLYLDRLRLE